jgi:hypothetical protein
MEVLCQSPGRTPAEKSVRGSVVEERLDKTRNERGRKGGNTPRHRKLPKFQTHINSLILHPTLCPGPLRVENGNTEEEIDTQADPESGFDGSI